MLANGGEHRWDGHPAHQTAPFRGDLPALAGMPDGWDLVIGNPPYMNVPTGQAPTFKRLGYAAGPGNLYEAFLESAAERLVKRNGSLMMIVPHSIQWSVRTGTLRGIIEEHFPGIRVRTYDNNPVPVFPKTSWLDGTTKTESRQRVSVIHAEGRGCRAGPFLSCLTGRMTESGEAWVDRGHPQACLDDDTGSAGTGGTPFRAGRAQRFRRAARRRVPPRRAPRSGPGHGVGAVMTASRASCARAA